MSNNDKNDTPGVDEFVRQAARETESVVREVSSAARQVASQYAGIAKKTLTEVYTDLSRDFSSPPKPRAPRGYAQISRTTTNTATTHKKKKKRTRLEKKSGKFTSVFLLLLSIPLLIAGASFLASAAQSFFGDGSGGWSDLIMGVFFFTGGLITFFSRNIGVRRYGRYKKYHAFVDRRGVVPLTEIAQATGIPVKTVTRDIQIMITSGYFDTGAYIDSELDSIALSQQAAEEVKRAIRSAHEAPLTSDQTPDNIFMPIIMELREVKATIADAAISEKVNRLEELTGKIFRIVEENPGKQPQIRRFMSYYLPTTLKLLRSYATLEKQGIKGENIMAAKKNIGGILDTLATGYEQQLDLLFKSDAMDIAADITVLENLMQQDGLAGDKSGFQTMAGT